MTHTADIAIIESVLDGHPEAFERLVHKYDRQLSRFVGAMVRNRLDAQDIVQDVWLVAYEHLPALRDRKRFSAWLRVIARNQCLTHACEPKVNYAQWSNEWEDELHHPDDEHLKRARSRVVRKAVRSLSQALHRTVTMHYFNGYTCDEVSHQMKVPVGTVKRRLSDARSKLRNMFGNWPRFPLPDNLGLPSLVIALPICSGSFIS